MTVHHPRYHKHREHRDARGARFAWALARARGPIMNLELEQVLSQRLRRYLPRGFILVQYTKIYHVKSAILEITTFNQSKFYFSLKLQEIVCTS